MSSRAILAFLVPGLLVACSTQPTMLNPSGGPTDPKAAETPPAMASHVLEPMGAGMNDQPNDTDTGMHQQMEGMGMPGMGGMDMSGMDMQGDASRPASQPATTQVAAYYTCAMHTEIHQDQPGKCPICGMTLVKKESASGTQKGESK